MERLQAVGIGIDGARPRLWALLPFALAISAPLFAAPQSSAPQGETDFTIEALLNMRVTSVSKEDQKLAQVAAAVSVITRDDIRTSGATNIPDLLRLVPGLDVARINANTWAISARGFNSQFANKLLVMVDSRAVYTPLLGGVNWDTVDVPLENIERIEVIRGPGGTVWGDNAVNGVINIITRKAQDMAGGLVTAGGGTSQQGFGSIRYGGAINAGTSYMAFANYRNLGNFPDLTGQSGQDGMHLIHGGFRVDSNLDPSDTVTIQGDVYTGHEGASFVHSVLAPPENVNVYGGAALSGANILGRWTHSFSGTSDITVQSYFDRYIRSGPESAEHRDTFDVDLRHHLILGDRNDLTWGVGYRYTDDHTVGTIDQAFLPANQVGWLFTLFAQDQVTLKPDRLFLYLGAKVERSYFGGVDFAPSLRLAWTPDSRRTFWLAVSNAHRTPTRHDLDLSAALAALPGPEEVVLLGNPALRDENVNAYEAGFRTHFNNRLSIDVATFFNLYNHLETQEPLPSFQEIYNNTPLTVDPIRFANKMHGSTEGIEASVKWTVANGWTLSPGYSFLEMHLHTDHDSLDSGRVADSQGSSPVHQAQLRSQLKLPHQWEWDSNLFFVGSLPAQGVPSYTRLDSLLTWRFSERAQFSFVGQNLLSDHHLENNDAYAIVNSSQVKRSAYVKFVYHF